MGNRWPEYLLEDICIGIFDCPHSTPILSDFGPYMVRTQDIRQGFFNTSSAVHVSDEVYIERTRRVEPHNGDLVFSREGTYFGDAAEVPPNTKVCLGQRMVLLRPNAKIIRSRYLRMYINSPAFQARLLQYRDGTVAERLNLPVIRQLPIKVPTPAEQKFIEDKISCLEKKIELNRQMNATLEAMAQALFKSWFVDFDPVIDNALAAGNPIPEPLHTRAEARKALGDRRKPLPREIQRQFPDSFVFTEELGWIPEGWEIASLESIIEIIGGGTPKTNIEEYWGGSIPWFSVVDAPNPSDVFVINTEKYITQQGLDNSSARLLPKGTTIISARGTVGKCALVAQPMSTNQSCYAIRGKSNIADYFVYYTILLRVADLQQKGHGSVFNTITRDTFKTISTPICHSDLTSQFDTMVEPYLNKILKNCKQSITLITLRDTLLPKLLSGRLRLPDSLIDKFAAREDISDPEQLIAEAV